jgi:hypothetical protein
MYMCLCIYTDSFITPCEWDYLALKIRISIPSTRLFCHEWKWNLEEGEVPCDGAQRCGDPTISLLREQDLVL